MADPTGNKSVIQKNTFFNNTKNITSSQTWFNVKVKNYILIIHNTNSLNHNQCPKHCCCSHIFPYIKSLLTILMSVSTKIHSAQPGTMAGRFGTTGISTSGSGSETEALALLETFFSLGLTESAKIKRFCGSYNSRYIIINP